MPDWTPGRTGSRADTDIPVFEVDLPVNIDRKKAAVQRALGALPASVRLVPLDFEHDDLIAALAEHGYRADARTFFIWEGVTQYLTDDAVRATLDAAAAGGAGQPAGVHLRPTGLHRRREPVRRRSRCTAVPAAAAGVAVRA